MKILITIFISMLITTTALCSVKCIPSESKSQLNILQIVNDNQPTLISMTQSVPLLIVKEKLDERSGCCSHHHGVCGCSDGRAVCCDNTLSPSCGCD